MRTIVDVSSMAWSPDGRQLAFMGLMEGPTADLYLYSLEDGQIRWLSSGPAHAIRPSWSPDGDYIVHHGVLGMGTGAGFSVTGAW
ncbi:MAG TPA: hypothetical protein VJ398_02195, partial [Acidimicrobiia bacterium]|nr:hypothetical protein [Acidimicrobiia bacterium]